MPPILFASLGERDLTQTGDHSKQATAIKGIYGKITVLQSEKTVQAELACSRLSDSGEHGKEKGTRLSRSLEQAKAEFEMFRSRRRSSCRHMRQLLTLTGLTFPEKYEPVP